MVMPSARMKIERRQVRPDARPDHGNPLGRGVGGVERMEHELHALSFVLPVQLGVAVLGADEGTAADPVAIAQPVSRSKNHPDAELPG